MNREIKFRAWHRIEDKMCEVTTLTDEGAYLVGVAGQPEEITLERNEYGDEIEVYHPETIDGRFCVFPEFYLMQYTGLKDKNGKEIYEGDIIQYKHYYLAKKWWMQDVDYEAQRQRDDYSIQRSPIIYENGVFKINHLTAEHIHYGEMLSKASTHSCDYEEKYWGFEVVGNMYEHPHLIEELFD